MKPLLPPFGTTLRCLMGLMVVCLMSMAGPLGLCTRQAAAIPQNGDPYNYFRFFGQEGTTANRFFVQVDTEEGPSTGTVFITLPEVAETVYFVDFATGRIANPRITLPTQARFNASIRDVTGSVSFTAPPDPSGRDRIAVSVVSQINLPFDIPGAIDTLNYSSGFVDPTEESFVTLRPNFALGGLAGVNNAAGAPLITQRPNEIAVQYTLQALNPGRPAPVSFVYELEGSVSIDHTIFDERLWASREAFRLTQRNISEVQDAMFARSALSASTNAARVFSRLRQGLSVTASEALSFGALAKALIGVEQLSDDLMVTPQGYRNIDIESYHRTLQEVSTARLQEIAWSDLLPDAAALAALQFGRGAATNHAAWLEAYLNDPPRDDFDVISGQAAFSLPVEVTLAIEDDVRQTVESQMEMLMNGASLLAAVERYSGARLPTVGDPAAAIAQESAAVSLDARHNADGTQLLSAAAGFREDLETELLNDPFTDAEIELLEEFFTTDLIAFAFTTPLPAEFGVTLEDQQNLVGVLSEAWRIIEGVEGIDLNAIETYMAPVRVVSRHDLTGQLVIETTGDFNGDGLVSAADYVVLRDAGGDISANYAAFAANFGRGSGGVASNIAVPEPLSVFFALAAVGVSGFVRQR